jgi:dipeptidyl aminopeptidase/acylaminoacyl peptidase
MTVFERAPVFDSRPRRSFGFAFVLLSALGAAESWAVERTSFVASDVALLKDVASPALSPDGHWVAYVTTTNDLAKDEQNADVWLASWDGKENRQLTKTRKSESQPAWSPDGRLLAYVASASDDPDDEDATEQVWLVDRSGGAPRQVTRLAGDVTEFAWAPDGRRLAVVAWDEDHRRTAKGATPPPIVIDRFFFKDDGYGYLGPERRRLYLVDVETGQATRFRDDPHGESRPSWSPDGRLLAFLGRDSPDPDRDNKFTLYVAEPHAGSTPRRITRFQGENGDSAWMSEPRWSPDGRRLVYTAGGDPQLVYYATYGPYVVDVAGGEPRALARALDRSMLEPRWAPDGRSVYVLIEDDRNQHVARISLGDDRLERVLDGRREAWDYDVGPDGRIAVLDSTPDAPPEVYALHRGRPRALSRQNDAWLAGKRLGAVEETSFRSRDGTEVRGLIVKPPGFVPGRRYPAILDLHGGPVAQHGNGFWTYWQVLASAGYVVILPNPRGSSGRGQEYALGIWADWGNNDGQDVLAAVDHAVSLGYADPARLGVGGWSYGGILTNQVIARDGRFKAAYSGAGLGNALAGYGTDMYVREYEAELGTPWENLDAYLRNSHPFVNAGRIATPTLFLCGELDFNVPLLNSEQMYQALKSRGVDTQLVIYPGQHHGLEVPSYLVDRARRILDWYGRYLQPAP